MKKMFLFLVCGGLFLTLLTGCEYLDEENSIESNYDNVPEEERTYNGILYNKGLYIKKEDRTSSGESYYAFSESEKTVVMERTNGFKNGSLKCHVFEGTYEGDLSGEVVLHFTKCDNKDCNQTDTITFKEGESTSGRVKSKKKFASPSTPISRAKICLADMEE